MEIQFYGANCVKLANKRIKLLIDDNLKSLGLKSITNENDISLQTFVGESLDSGGFIINGPGEYEISEVSIVGVPARAHVDSDGYKATIYSVKMNNFNIVIVGHIDPNISDDQLEKIGVVDVLIVPVGGFGYTLEPEEAVQIIKKFEPKIAIPTHYADDKIKYEVPQADLQLFLKAIGVLDPEYTDSLVLKENILGEKTKVVVINRTN